MYSVARAYYLIGDDMIDIKGIPQYNENYYGDYTGKYPYVAASKAATGIYKHLKKFYKGGWFPDYDPEEPPEIVFILTNMETGEHVQYHGARVPAHQGNRTLVGDQGRVRNYKWDNIVTKIED